MDNKSGYHPMNYTVLVSPREQRKATSGGLLLPEEVADRESFARQEGVIVELAPMAFTFADWPASTPKPQPGDRVAFAKYASAEGQFKGHDGADYWLVPDKAIMAIVEQDPDEEQ